MQIHFHLGLQSALLYGEITSHINRVELWAGAVEVGSTAAGPSLLQTAPDTQRPAAHSTTHPHSAGFRGSPVAPFQSRALGVLTAACCQQRSSILVSSWGWQESFQPYPQPDWWQWHPLNVSVQQRRITFITEAFLPLLEFSEAWKTVSASD